MLIVGWVMIKNTLDLLFSAIDEISSLSCQKVADSITSSKFSNNVTKRASVLLRYIYPNAFVVIRQHTARYNFW